MTQPAFTGPDLCKLSATAIVDLLRKREVSTPELLDAVYTRIDQTDPEINAMVTRCEDRARGWQVPADDGAPGGMAGMPVGIKDLNEVEGVRTTWGTLGLKDNIPDKSDRLVQRIEARGGVVVGKTNSPEMGAGGNTFNAVFGYTRNPWDTRMNAGGSSGGAAASLAAGQTWLSHGSDLAGSLRTPAAYCGVVGLRPSPGVAGGGPGDLRFHREALQGPMARSVQDCALFLDVMTGFDPAEPLSWPAPEVPYQTAAMQGDEKVRVAYAPTLDGLTYISAEMDTALRAALAKVEAAGGMVDEACPELPRLEHAYRTLRARLWAAGPGRAPKEITQHFKATLAGNIQDGFDLTIDDVVRADLARSKIFDNVAAFLQDFDVIACPVVGLMQREVEVEYPKEIDGTPLNDYLEWLKFSYLAPTIGLPAISVPVGLNAAGLPVGIQLIGSHRSEARLLQVARAFEVACGGPLGPIDPVVRH